MITDDFAAFQAKMEELGRDLPRKVARVALTRTVTTARREVMAELPKVFDRPTPFTVNSIRYQIASAESPDAKVYISDDGPKGMSPRKYLQAEIEGGPRRAKRSERALAAAGLMNAGERIMPGVGVQLDQYGNVPGSRVVTILSRLSAFGQQGYRANVSPTVKKRLRRRKLASAQTGTEYFIGQSRATGTLGVYQVMGRGKVMPVLALVGKQPAYKARFDFRGLVFTSAMKSWPAEMARALQEFMRAK